MKKMIFFIGLLTLICLGYRINAQGTVKLKGKDITIILNDASAYQEGIDRLNRGDFQGSIKSCTRMIDGDPKFDDAYNIRGLAYTALKQYNKAIPDFTKAIELSQRSFYYYNRGNTYIAIKQWDKAIADFLKAISITSDDAAFYAQLGLCYLNKNDYDKAIEFTKKAITLNSQDTNYCVQLRTCYKGKVKNGSEIFSKNPCDLTQYDQNETYVNNSGNFEGSIEFVITSIGGDKCRLKLREYPRNIFYLSTEDAIKYGLVERLGGILQTSKIEGTKIKINVRDSWINSLVTLSK